MMSAKKSAGGGDDEEYSQEGSHSQEGSQFTHVLDDVPVPIVNRGDVSVSPNGYKLVELVKNKIADGHSVFVRQITDKVVKKLDSDDNFKRLDNDRQNTIKNKKIRESIRAVFALYVDPIPQMKMVWHKDLVDAAKKYEGFPCGLTGVWDKPYEGVHHAHMEHANVQHLHNLLVGYNILSGGGYEWHDSLYVRLITFYQVINEHDIRTKDVMEPDGKCKQTFANENDKYMYIVKEFNRLYTENQLRQGEKQSKDDFPPEDILANMLEFYFAWYLPNEIKSNAPFSHDGRPDDVRKSGNYTWVFVELLVKWVQKLSVAMGQADDKEKELILVAKEEDDDDISDNQGMINEIRLIPLITLIADCNPALSIKKNGAKDYISIVRETSDDIQKFTAKPIDTSLFFAVISAIPAIKEAIAMKKSWNDNLKLNVSNPDHAVALKQFLYTNICFRYKLMDRIRNRKLYNVKNMTVPDSTQGCHDNRERTWGRILREAGVKHATPDDIVGTLILSSSDIVSVSDKSILNLNYNFADAKTHLDRINTTTYTQTIESFNDRKTRVTSNIAALKTDIDKYQICYDKAYQTKQTEEDNTSRRPTRLVKPISKTLVAAIDDVNKYEEILTPLYEEYERAKGKLEIMNEMKEHPITALTQPSPIMNFQRENRKYVGLPLYGIAEEIAEEDELSFQTVQEGKKKLQTVQEGKKKRIVLDELAAQYSEDELAAQDSERSQDSSDANSSDKEFIDDDDDLSPPVSAELKEALKGLRGVKAGQMANASENVNILSTRQKDVGTSVTNIFPPIATFNQPNNVVTNALPSTLPIKSRFPLIPISNKSNKPKGGTRRKRLPNKSNRTRKGRRVRKGSKSKRTRRVRKSGKSSRKKNTRRDVKK